MIITSMVQAETKVVIDTSGSVFAYELKDTTSGEVVYWLPSSYQPTHGVESNWAEQLTKGATISWNDKKSVVVIAEDNRHFMGDLWILAFGGEEAVPQGIFQSNSQQAS